jgi:hypothetical protein
MKPLLSTQFLAGVAVALGAFTAVSPANAGSDVYFSIGVQTPGFYVQSVPVYVQPLPIYMPRPVRPWHFDDGYRYDERHGRPEDVYSNHNRFARANIHESPITRDHWRPVDRYGSFGDLARDGVRNQFDRNHDGDGVRNRVDRLPDNPYRR